MILEDLNGLELGAIYSRPHLSEKTTDGFQSCELEISIFLPSLKEFIVIDSFFEDPEDRDNSPTLLKVFMSNKAMNSKISGGEGKLFEPEIIYAESLGKIFNWRFRKNRQNSTFDIGDNIIIQTDSGKAIEIFGSDFLPFNMIRVDQIS